jgi:hypothetical protein
MLVACKISHVAAAQPRVGERPSVSWLVEALVDNPTRRAPADPTLLAGVGESDRWLVRVRAARGLPLRRNNARSTEPG